LTVPTADTESYGLLFYDLTSRQTSRPEPVQGSSRTFPINVITISPDGRWLVYAQRDQLDYDLMLVENFR